MKTRCLNPHSKSYKWYGAKGIGICEEWKTDFMNFWNWAMGNGYSDELTLDRIDPSGNYCPKNCRWVTWNVQCDNKRNSCPKFNGKSLKDISQESGISYYTLHSRLTRLNDIPIDKEPRSSKYGRNIFLYHGKYQVCVRNHYVGRYPTIEEAVKARDEYERSI